MLTVYISDCNSNIQLGLCLGQVLCGCVHFLNEIFNVWDVHLRFTILNLKLQEQEGLSDVIVEDMMSLIWSKCWTWSVLLPFRSSPCLWWSGSLSPPLSCLSLPLLGISVQIGNDKPHSRFFHRNTLEKSWVKIPHSWSIFTTFLKLKKYFLLPHSLQFHQWCNDTFWLMRLILLSLDGEKEVRGVGQEEVTLWYNGCNKAGKNWVD